MSDLKAFYRVLAAFKMFHSGEKFLQAIKARKTLEEDFCDAILKASRCVTSFLNPYLVENNISLP